METERKRVLARRYSKASRVVDQYLDDNDCGIAVLRVVSEPFNQACIVMEDILAEIEADADFQVWKGGT